MGQRHPGFSWSSPGGTTNAWQQNNSRPQGQGALAYQNQQRQQFQPQQPIQSGLEDLMKAFIIKTDERPDAHGAAIKEIGTLPIDTKENPKETVNAVTLRSGQVLKDPTPIQDNVILEKESGKQLKNDVDKKMKAPMKIEKKKKEETSRREEPEDSKNMPALPSPQKLCREKLDKHFEKFLDVLKQVHVNFPFTKVLSPMPAYAKFLKEILTNKRKIEETSVVKLIEHLVNMEENKEIPLILGRPFLTIGRAILDIHERKLMLRVGEETVTFDMNVAKGAQKETSAASVEWKVKGSK
ncbi:uncharacterized protein [Nicotiana tomentosiformis]|uniref:uncharacterized protein n=1 Tax=Nicotiana tomentosiformis TaxID=4098 RepID=UPI00388C3EB8